MTKTEKELEGLVHSTVEQLGYELYDVEYVKEGHDWFLRLYIDAQEKSIDLDDCEKVSNAVSDLLDEKDPIVDSYHLEVSSCGLERHLREVKHFQAAVGQRIEVKLFTTFAGRKSYEGELQTVTEETITILQEKEVVNIPISNISSAKILYNWEE